MSEWHVELYLVILWVEKFNYTFNRYCKIKKKNPTTLFAYIWNYIIFLLQSSAHSNLINFFQLLEKENKVCSFLY